MADSAFEFEPESDSSSVDGGGANERLCRRIESLHQENRVLKAEVETLKLKNKGLMNSNEQLRRNSVNIQAKAEQEEEYISNTLLKKITELKKEKEALAISYEQEEECLTNDLIRKFTQLRQEKSVLERTLAREQEDQVTKLKLRIAKLETDANKKQESLDRLRREKVELESALEQEQEGLVNRLWKKMDKLEAEKRELQIKLESLGALLSSGSSRTSSTSALGGQAQQHSPSTESMSKLLATGGSGSPRRPRSSLRHQRSTPSPLATAPPQQQSPSPQPLSASWLTTASSDSFDHTATISPGGFIKSSTNNSSSNIIRDLQASGTCGGNSLTRPLVQSPMDIESIYNNTPASHSSGFVTPPPPPNHAKSPAGAATSLNNRHQPVDSTYVDRLRLQVDRLRHLLTEYQSDYAFKLPAWERERQTITEENRRMRELLEEEKRRRETLCRTLSESESSLEMEDERQFNEACRSNSRSRTTSDTMHQPPPPFSAGPMPSGAFHSLYGPGHAFAVAMASCCRECGQPLPPPPVASSDWPLAGRRSTPPASLAPYSGSARNSWVSGGGSDTEHQRRSQILTPTKPFLQPPSPINTTDSPRDIELRSTIDDDYEEEDDDARCVTPPCQPSPVAPSPADH